jgi:hypothetical protein
MADSGLDDAGIQRMRNLGFAAQSRKSVEKLLRDWDKCGSGRQVEGIGMHECDIPERVDGHVWWREPEAEQEI